MDIYLIRHTVTTVHHSVCFGRTDVPLAETFDVDASRVLDKLPHRDALTVYSSPLQRCRSLAKKISPFFYMDDRLMELHFGAWEMKKWDDISREELDPWMENYTELAPPGGESCNELALRSRECFEEILRREHSSVAVVTHAGVIRALLAGLLEIPLSASFTFSIDHGGVTRIDAVDGRRTIAYVNR